MNKYSLCDEFVSHLGRRRGIQTLNGNKMDIILYLILLNLCIFPLQDVSLLNMVYSVISISLSNIQYVQKGILADGSADCQASVQDGQCSMADLRQKGFGWDTFGWASGIIDTFVTLV